MKNLGVLGPGDEFGSFYVLCNDVLRVSTGFSQFFPGTRPVKLRWYQ